MPEVDAFRTPGGQRVPVADTLQAELVSAGEGKAVIRYPVLPEFTNPMGQLQGGMYAVMMDSAMAIAANGIATATMQFTILRPSAPGMVLTVTGEVIKAGRRLVYAQAEVRDEAGNLIALGNQSGPPRVAADGPPAG